MAEVAEDLIEAGEIQVAVLDEQVHHEHHVALRQRWTGLGLAEPVAA